ncbi:hypothetical protein EGW08_010023 [Elysia chlorotica]|uniref:Reverse transcriptase domain-containing protein n=1 Tax=Elysia chlorotica TaxID=188477 RepID=A0A433TKT9_ELYCH|nr:hypothetical protein EGW08_010023 [Elysia chlorotica]
MATLNGEKTKTGPVILENEGATVIGKRAANLFVKQYADISDIEIDKDRRRQVNLDIQELKEVSHGQKDIEMARQLTHEELERAIKALKMKKSPGPDQVTNEMIVNLGHGMKRKLLQLFNTSWKTGRIPHAWKVANMTPIYKQGKNKGKAESYRPISLLSCLCKKMERMVKTRMTWHIESNNIIIEEQAGFRKGRCTEDQITLISQNIEDGFQEKKNTLVVWIDMEKAFDRVWKKGLSYKLQKQKQRKGRKLQTDQPSKLSLQNYGKNGQYTTDLALESNNILIEEQAGFRKGRCTEDQITLISQNIEDGFQEKKNTLVVWIDMEKAFDRVWKKGLSYKLQKYGVMGKMHQWITEYLRDRKARVKIQNHTSRCHTLKQGVPQGSVLSPILFSIYINDIQKIIPKGVNAALYADDLAIWATEESIGTAKVRLQNALDNLKMWTHDWIMKVNAEKTTYTTFTLSTKKTSAISHSMGRN